jgi:S1-C subfamily serine protease
VEEPVSVLAPATTQSLPPAVLDEVKKATVFVKVETTRLAGSGSGFVVKTEGETAYVVTNHHVVTPPQDASLPSVFRMPRGPMFRRPGVAIPGRDRPAITVVFQSGTPRERALAATVLLADAERDLAVLKVANVSDLPRPIPLIRNPHLIETMPVFLFGFPFGEVLATSRGNPAITVGRGSVSSIRLDDHGEVARIQIDGDLNPGNSGGPVVDGQGRLVGIAVAKVRNSQIGLAIPPGTLIKMLEQSVRR